METRAQIFEGNVDASDLRFGIVVSRFNAQITDSLLDGALEALSQQGADPTNIFVLKVPGAFELSAAASRISENDSVDAVICLGAIIRGDTPHFEYISNACAQGIDQAARELGLPITFGVLTCDTLEQAVARSGDMAGNKGAEAAVAAIEMATLFRALEEAEL
jgi:6,7-dimethyl-8-ribityllumazine synthase